MAECGVLKTGASIPLLGLGTFEAGSYTHEEKTAAISTAIKTIASRMPQTPNGSRKVAIAVNLSDQSAYVVRWAVANYLRREDVQPTSILYGADWGATDQSIDTSDEGSQQRLESSFDTFTSNKAADLAKPILDAKIPYTIHIVKDHNMKERVCLEVEWLGVNAVIMGS